ncbi:hypothetical protein RIF29_14101 [Crotalaria pallida]|uniref:Uncharacterized protein n=1 Tax=Crotalaria pallida TaxID=3830 RepID=A0AAN9IDH2_CROPI
MPFHSSSQSLLSNSVATIPLLSLSHSLSFSNSRSFLFSLSPNLRRLLSRRCCSLYRRCSLAMVVLSMLLCLFSSQVSIVKPSSSSSFSSLLSLLSLRSAIVNRHHPCSIVAAIIGARVTVMFTTSPLLQYNLELAVQFQWELLESMQVGTLEPEVVFLNASLIPNIFPVLAVAHKALLAKSRDSLTTRTLHSELVYNYSGSKHIAESFKRCGISDSTTYVLAARFDATPDVIQSIEKIGPFIEKFHKEADKYASLTFITHNNGYATENYDPLNLGIYIEDKKSELSVLVYRATGGSSIKDDEEELMLHRYTMQCYTTWRVLQDDGKGVAEALNEKVCVNNTCEEELTV